MITGFLDSFTSVSYTFVDLDYLIMIIDCVKIGLFICEIFNLKSLGIKINNPSFWRPLSHSHQ